ncbi:M23 family metallopeptidase [Pontiellaceae bacterium B12227]|nr:M23 family metallopeptidase [Pontiellaceae bacterium B12227]
MKPITLLVLTAALPVLAFGADMMTPAYYTGNLKGEADVFLSACQQIHMHHPLENPEGRMPDYRIPRWGAFGAGKGPTRTEQHHPAEDLHIGQRETAVELYAAHDGIISTVRDAPKYRHYISITKIITDPDGRELGKLVTLYGHVDLDLDEAAGLNLNGKTVKAGELISKHLYGQTRGGPHLHFEIRYYRPTDRGTEEFYSMNGSVPGAGEWPKGRWDPDTGYGFGLAENHALKL